MNAIVTFLLSDESNSDQFILSPEESSCTGKPRVSR